MFEETILMQYGSLGIFVAYLIYDRQVLLKNLTQTLRDLKEELKKRK